MLIKPISSVSIATATTVLSCEMRSRDQGRQIACTYKNIAELPGDNTGFFPPRFSKFSFLKILANIHGISGEYSVEVDPNPPGGQVGRPS